jgi:hypothetical protein
VVEYVDGVLPLLQEADPYVLRELYLVVSGNCEKDLQGLQKNWCVRHFGESYVQFGPNAPAKKDFGICDLNPQNTHEFDLAKLLLRIFGEKETGETQERLRLWGEYRKENLTEGEANFKVGEANLKEGEANLSSEPPENRNGLEGVRLLPLFFVLIEILFVPQKLLFFMICALGVAMISCYLLCC